MWSEVMEYLGLAITIFLVVLVLQELWYWLVHGKSGE